MHKALKFRRPLRFGSGLVATTLSRVLLSSVLFGYGGGIVLSLLLFLPVVRQFILGAPMPASSLPLMYLLLVGILVEYVIVLALVGARHLSAPWVRETYLDDKLPWQLKVLYWDKIPTDTKVMMFLKRVHTATTAGFIYRNAPYDICADQPGGSLSGIPTTLGRIFRRWRGRPNVRSVEQEYTDDGDGDLDIPLLPTVESNHPSQEFPSSPSISATLGGEAQGFDSVTREHAERLRAIQLAFVASKAEDTGEGVKAGLASVVAAMIWLGRIDPRRGIMDFAYDMGVPVRRLRLRNRAM